MKAEIIGIGTEILLGQVVDTNSAFLARELANLGIEVYYHSVVGDNTERLTSQLDTAMRRSDLVVMSGGLGPTQDDLTKQTVANYLGIPLVMDQTAMAKIDDYYHQTGREEAPNNALQAMYLQGATVMPNDNGMAVGNFYQQSDGADVMLLPGPPTEMTMMFNHYGRGLLEAAYHRNEFLVSRVLRFYGIGESLLVTKLSDLIDQQTNPTIAPYAKTNEVTLRLTASAEQEAKAKGLLDGMEAQIQARVGDYLYGYGDDNSLEAVVVAGLKDQQLTITAAESLTAGQFQSTLGNVPGVSTVFPGGFVTYSAEAKAALLQIPSEIIEKYGVVSEQTAVWMAKQAKKTLQTDIGISFTGVAGPEELEGQPAGTVWIGIAFKDQTPFGRLIHLAGTRDRIRERSVMAGLDLIRRQLLTLK
ncbi:competence/damage-inducible protein A [Levilactobacillus bambusae]|uniref:Putative competence-damage inducible protein n=1 Tax=Levilactobacillus bambusae TaxID=2024736 RepID=A0A2V1MWX5_9LACO|nr:competence/damage-inducible protein A [Levilactobacillus bambusae]PWF99573.1 competence/damage-inducible protein A [Levilactobacillus bambusae]